MKKKNNSLKIGVLFGIISFVVLTFLTEGLVEVSKEVGLWRWLGEMSIYALTNKLVEKMVASVAIGGSVAYVTHMINYSKAVKNQRRGKTTHLQFTTEDSNTTRTA